MAVPLECSFDGAGGAVVATKPAGVGVTLPPTIRRAQAITNPQTDCRRCDLDRPARWRRDVPVVVATAPGPLRASAALAALARLRALRSARCDAADRAARRLRVPLARSGPAPAALRSAAFVASAPPVGPLAPAACGGASHGKPRHGWRRGSAGGVSADGVRVSGGGSSPAFACFWSFGRGCAQVGASCHRPPGPGFSPPASFHANRPHTAPRPPVFILSARLRSAPLCASRPAFFAPLRAVRFGRRPPPGCTAPVPTPPGKTTRAGCSRGRACWRKNPASTKTRGPALLCALLRRAFGLRPARWSLASGLRPARLRLAGPRSRAVQVRAAIQACAGHPCALRLLGNSIFLASALRLRRVVVSLVWPAWSVDRSTITAKQ